ncbi:TetR/AcrR family transcriptional regulator [Agromyces sp. MMS24-JH15]|uniref:TetR/AcrR family transcriptional regulator n=1 Tax=Agromyces sp. MMS24-JH15 TaxID=3243765 RepID=UPI0037479AB9
MSRVPRGRPRDVAGRRAALEAARDLVVAEGYDRLSMAEIAQRAGVGRQTLYRWWPSKQAIVADCVLDEALPLQLDLATASGDLAADLGAWMSRSADALAADAPAELYRALLAAAASDPAAAARMEERFDRPLRRAILDAFAAAGRAEESAELAADLLMGALLNVIVTRDPAARSRLVRVAELALRTDAGA